MKQANNGKCLEYAVYTTFTAWIAKIGGPGLTVNRSSQNTWNKLDKNIRKDFIKFARVLLEHFNNAIKPTSIIKRASDRDGILGYVSDVIVDDIGISIKNTKTYIKSQRPSALPKQLDLDIYDTEIYNSVYKEIAQQPYKDYGDTLCTNISYKDEMYRNICEITAFYLNKATKEQVQKFFRFLTGEPHYQAINMKEDVYIYDFTKKTLPEKLYAYLSSNDHLIITFDNNWICDLRIHTASKTITPNCSLKFDTVLSNQDEIVPFKKFTKK